MAELKLDGLGHVSKVSTDGDLIVLTPQDFTNLIQSLKDRIGNSNITVPTDVQIIDGELLLPDAKDISGGSSTDAVVTINTFADVFNNLLGGTAIEVSVLRKGFTATAGQTLVDLNALFGAGVEYVPAPGLGTDRHNLTIWVNGIKQMFTAGAYTEDSSTTFTFATGLILGQQVEIEILP